jgi:hypothetical protein
LAFIITIQKGVSIMTEKRSLITLSDQQAIAWYQHHLLVMHGYALSLALKAGLSPVEAASIFVEPWHSNRSSIHSQATAQILEQQARQIAEVSALTYSEHVQLVQQGQSWLVQVTIADPEPLERSGASLEHYTQWVKEQLRQVCEPKGILCRVWLDHDRLYIQLSLQADQ